MPARDFRLNLAPNLFPVEAFFNVMPDERFVEHVQDLVEGTTLGFHDVICEFPSSLDPGEEPFSGVRFLANDEELVLSYLEFVDYLELACQVQMADFPDTTASLQSLINVARTQDPPE